MTPQTWFVTSILTLVIVLLASNRVAVDVAMVGGLALILLGNSVLGGILTLDQALQAYANPALLLIGSLFIVAAGLSETGAIQDVAKRLLGHPPTASRAQIRLMAPVAFLSGFMNNTPIVAMYLPIVLDWARRLRMSPSRLLLPLSFAAILGGKLTLIGTASNVILVGLFEGLVEEGGWAASQPLDSASLFWGIAVLGLPTALAGIAFIVGLSRWLLPERASIEVKQQPRSYQVRVRVDQNSPAAGRSVHDAGLRNLPGLFLTQVERAGEIRLATPETKLRAGDLLAFVGVLQSVVDLRKMRGLTPLGEEEEVDAPPPSGPQRVLVEAVVARGSALEGRTPRDSGFRARHNAAIVAVHRDGEAVKGKIGEIVLRAGDTLLLDTPPDAARAIQSSKDFYLASSVEDSRSLRHDRAPVALVIVALLVVLLTTSLIEPALAALSCAGLMVLTRCLPSALARSSIQWPVLTVIGSALAMGAAVKNTGLANLLAEGLLALCHGAPTGVVVFAVFVLTAAFAQLITSNGSAVLMFPVAMAAAQATGVGPQAMLFTLMIAAGSTFVSPVAYQTNLMVYGPGGYHFVDFVRIGLPLTLLLGLICAVLAPLVYPL